jgi:hypothetical protein
MRADAYEYALDDGDGEINIGPALDADVLWGNYFFVEGGFDTVTTVRVALGTIPAGRDIELLVFDDPDDDLDPANAVPVASLPAQTFADEPNDHFYEYDLPDVAVSGGFFVAARMQLAVGDRPARLDSSTVLGRSWLMYGDPIDPNGLGASPFILNMDDAPFPGTWMVRATAVPAPGGGLLLLAAWGLRSRSRRSI